MPADEPQYRLRKGRLEPVDSAREHLPQPGAERPRSAGVVVLIAILGVLIGLGIALAGWLALGDSRFAGVMRMAQAPAGPTSPEAASASAPSPPAGGDFTARLRENGATACSAQVNAVAAATNVGVSQFNTVSTWAMAAVDKRLVSVSIAQKYPDGAPVPYGATSVVAAPNPVGPCDALAVQVVPSPLSCAKVRETLAGTSRQMGDLVGVSLMGDADGQTMLVPTAGNGCVLVGVRAAYGK